MGKGPLGTSLDITAVTSATQPRSFEVEFPFGKSAAGQWVRHWLAIYIVYWNWLAAACHAAVASLADF